MRNTLYAALVVVATLSAPPQDKSHPRPCCFVHDTSLAGIQHRLK
ncbi:hypothetical protein [Alteromonas sp. B31-7]|nr:hypothetical protein [Alteromonas sp. B31-7]